MYDDDQPNAEPIDRPDDQPEPEDRRAWRRPPPPVDALQAIIAKHRSDFDRRTYDYGPLRDNRRLVRGTPEHAAAYGRRRPQWFAFASHITGKGRQTYLDQMRSEAGERYGPNAAEAVESLL